MGKTTDKTKLAFNNIVDTAVAIYNEKKADAKYDFRVAARAMVEEAFNLGKAVALGKAPAMEEEQPAKKPAKKAE